MIIEQTAAGDQSPSLRVGVIGLGIMGLAIARNLHLGGIAVSGFDIDATRQALAQVAGLPTALSLSELVHDRDLLLTSLPSDTALDAVVSDLLAHSALLHRKLMLAELSTLSIPCKLRNRDRLSAGGIEMLDCPLSGTGAQAQTRDLAIYASGDPHVYERCQPTLQAFSRSCAHVGAFGDGMRTKLVANLLVAIHNVATAEALDLAARAGLDVAKTLDLLSAGAACSRILELRGPLMVRGNYQPPTMKLDVWQKDLELIGAFARECDARTSLFHATLPVYKAALAAGLGQQDTAAVFSTLQAI